MQVVGAPDFLPGCDFIDRTTPDGPWIDTEIEDQDGDRYYLSKSSVLEMVRLLAEADEGFARDVEKLILVSGPISPEWFPSKDEDKAKPFDGMSLIMDEPDKFPCRLEGCDKVFDTVHKRSGHETGHKKKGEWDKGAA